MEVERQGRSVVIRVPIDDGERLVVAVDTQEAEELGRLLIEPEQRQAGALVGLGLPAGVEVLLGNEMVRRHAQ